MSTITVAVIGMLAGIFSPLLTEFLRGKTSLKEKQLELVLNKKYVAYENFSKKYGTFYKRSTKEEKKAFVSTAWSVILLCDNNSKILISDFLRTLENANDVTDQEIDVKFFQCMCSLNDDLNKSSIFKYGK